MLNVVRLWTTHAALTTQEPHCHRSLAGEHQRAYLFFPSWCSQPSRVQRLSFFVSESQDEFARLVEQWETHRLFFGIWERGGLLAVLLLTDGHGSAYGAHSFAIPLASSQGENGEKKEECQVECFKRLRFVA